MRKIRAFVAAVLLMAIFVGSAHWISGSLSLRVDNGRFGPWFNAYKDLSYSALSENIDPDTVLVMGSSEFRHGRDSKFHPINALNTEDMNLMMIGGPVNQILYHSIALGSLEPKLDSRKVVLLVSPNWFKKKGVSAVNYGVRFSESEYIHFMENPNIGSDIKQYVAERSEKLLAENNKFNTEVGIIDRYLNEGDDSFVSEFLYDAEKLMATDRDRISTLAALQTISHQDVLEPRAESISDEDFEEMLAQAERVSRKSSDNPLDISDRSWNNVIKKTYEKDKDAYHNKIYPDSPEFGDLEAFLGVCRQTGIQAKLIIMPVNGKWFDYVGTDREKRRETTDKVLKLAEEYGAETADLTTHEYDPYITMDVTHPWNMGWVLIDREIYKFCKEDTKGVE